jgi:hypothetical protein
MKALSTIVEDLLAWTTGNAPGDLVMPLTLGTPEAIASMRETIQQGQVEAAEIAAEPSQEKITEDMPSLDATLVLAMAIGIQGYGFFRAYGADGRRCPAGQFRAVVSSYRLIKPLRARLASHPDDPQVKPARRMLKELRERLKPCISRRVKAARLRASVRGETSDAEAASQWNVDPYENTGTLGAATLEMVVDLSCDESVGPDRDDVNDPGLSAEFLDGGELPIPARRPGGPARTDTRSRTSSAMSRPARGPATARAPLGAGRSTLQLGLMTVLALLVVVALLSTWPLIKARFKPSLDTYGQHLPVTGVARIDGGRAMILQLDTSWDDIGDDQRRQAVIDAYDSARDLEGIDELIVRDARGAEVARVRGGTITGLAP